MVAVLSSDIVLSPVCVCESHQPGVVLRVVGPMRSTPHGLAPVEWLRVRTPGERSADVRDRWRTAARLRALTAMADGRLTPMDAVQIRAYVRLRVNHDYHPVNVAPTAIACIAGLVDARVLPDQDRRRVLGPDMRHGLPLPSNPGGPVGELALHIVPLGDF